MTSYEKDVAIVVLIAGCIVTAALLFSNHTSHQSYQKCVESGQPNCLAILNPNLYHTNHLFDVPN